MKLRASRPTLFLGAAVLAALVFLLSWSAGSHNTLARAFLSIGLALQLQILFIAITDRRETQFELFLSLYMVVALIIPGIFQCAVGSFPLFNLSYLPSKVIGASIVVLIFCVVFQGVYLWRTSRLGYFGVESAARPRATINVAKSLVLLALLIALAAFYVLNSGIEQVLTRRQEFEADWSFDPLGAVFLYLGRYAGFFSFCIALVLFVKVRRYRFIFVPLLLLSTAVFLVTNSPTNVPRTLTFAYVICVLLAFFRLTGVRARMAIAAGYFAGVALISPFVNQFSRGVRGMPVEYNFLPQYAFSGDLDSFQSIINVKIWADATGLKWGHQLLSSALVFVPRSIWTTKSYPTGQLAADYVGYAYTNVSAPLPAELYSDFGWLGVIVAGLACAFLVLSLDRAVGRARLAGSTTRLIFFGTMTGFLGIIMRGSLLGVDGFTALAVVMAYGLRYTEGRPVRRTGDQGQPAAIRSAPVAPAGRSRASRTY